MEVPVVVFFIVPVVPVLVDLTIVVPIEAFEATVLVLAARVCCWRVAGREIVFRVVPVMVVVFALVLLLNLADAALDGRLFAGLC